MLKPVISHFTMKKGILPFLQELPSSEPQTAGKSGQLLGSEVELLWYGLV